MEPVSAGSSRQMQNGLGRRSPAGAFFLAGATRRTVRGPSRQVLLDKHRGGGGGAPTRGAPVLHLPRRTRRPRSVSWGNAARRPYLPRKTRCFWGRYKKVGWGRARFSPCVTGFAAAEVAPAGVFHAEHVLAYLLSMENSYTLLCSSSTTTHLPPRAPPSCTSRPSLRSLATRRSAERFERPSMSASSETVLVGLVEK